MDDCAKTTRKVVMAPHRIAPCVNLREMFGAQYRLSYEESYWAEKPENRRKEEAWLQIIACRHGHIYPQGGEELAASTDRRGPVALRLLALACCRRLTDCDDGLNVAFPVRDFDAVAEIMQPKRRRRLSSEHKAKLAEANWRHRFRPKKHASGVASSECASLQTTGDDQNYVRTAASVS